MPPAAHNLFLLQQLYLIIGLTCFSDNNFSIFFVKLIFAK